MSLRYALPVFLLSVFCQLSFASASIKSVQEQTFVYRENSEALFADQTSLINRLTQIGDQPLKQLFVSSHAAIPSDLSVTYTYSKDKISRYELFLSKKAYAKEVARYREEVKGYFRMFYPYDLQPYVEAKNILLKNNMSYDIFSRDGVGSYSIVDKDHQYLLSILERSRFSKLFSFVEEQSEHFGVLTPHLFIVDRDQLDITVIQDSQVSSNNRGALLLSKKLFETFSDQEINALISIKLAVLRFPVLKDSFLHKMATEDSIFTVISFMLLFAVFAPAYFRYYKVFGALFITYLIACGVLVFERYLRFRSSQRERKVQKFLYKNLSNTRALITLFDKIISHKRDQLKREKELVEAFVQEEHALTGTDKSLFTNEIKEWVVSRAKEFNKLVKDLTYQKHYFSVSHAAKSLEDRRKLS